VYVVVSQIIALLPALAVAAPLIVIVIVETAGVVQPVFGLAVNVSNTFPVWPAVGVYVGVSVVALVNVPGPGAVHNMLE
jgi:hypothetical protein